MTWTNFLHTVEIKILPTEDEIRSNHAEFLPATDLEQSHFLSGQAERHIDTFFRLLRHDIFGELKEGLGGMMGAIEENPAILQNSKLSLGGNVRAYSYPSAYVNYTSFSHRQGLEAQISFLQPSLVRKKSASEKRKFWEDSRRLEEGVLLCLLSFDGAKSSVLFFTVSGKNTDPKKDHGLCSDDRQATITVKLATKFKEDLSSMIRLSLQNTRGLLVELPAVILATFMPILENLQGMQRLSRLPFRQWILPDRNTINNSQACLDVPPPLYARSPGFTFPLDSICKVPGTRLRLSAGFSVENLTMRRIEDSTGLDRGQVQALVAALLREYAFIQGA